MAKRPNIHTARFELRCSQEELAYWRAVAASHGVSLAQYIRLALGERDLKLSKITKNYPKLPDFTKNYLKKDRPQTDPALIRQLSAIGNNLNQIARWCNTHTLQQDIQPVEEEIRAVRETLAALLAHGGSHAD